MSFIYVSGLAAGIDSSSSSKNNEEECETDTGDEAMDLRLDESSTSSCTRGHSPQGAPPRGGPSKPMDSIRSIFWYIKACVVGGLYPQVATIQAPRTYSVLPNPKH